MLGHVARALCGIFVLAGLLKQPDPSVNAEPPTLPPQMSRAALGEPAPSTTSKWLGEREETPLYRVYRVTAYCDRGLTAAGVPSGVGQCAAPADIPFGARIYIPALDRTFVATDRTAPRFRHNTVDLFMPSRGACKRFGCRYLECEITCPVEPARYGSPCLGAAVAAADP